MSRNKEKAQSTLNRYQAQISREAGVLESDPSQRPKYVQSVDKLPQAEKWRQTIMTEISVKLTQINDPTLPEPEIRELNDTLNKLHREKRAWEYHIKSLGGNDYINFGNLNLGLNIKGTRYYGRARDLVEVKQMTEVKPIENEQKVGLDYYGFFDTESIPPISVDRQSIMSEINTALGEKVLPAPMLDKANDELPSSEDVERWLVDKKRRELLAQLGL